MLLHTKELALGRCERLRLSLIHINDREILRAATCVVER